MFATVRILDPADVTPPTAIDAIEGRRADLLKLRVSRIDADALDDAIGAWPGHGWR